MHLYLLRYVGGVTVGLRTTFVRSHGMGLLRRDPSSDQFSTSTYVIRCSGQTELRAVLDERAVPGWVFKHHNSHWHLSLQC